MRFQTKNQSPLFRLGTLSLLCALSACGQKSAEAPTPSPAAGANSKSPPVTESISPDETVSDPSKGAPTFLAPALTLPEVYCDSEVTGRYNEVLAAAKRVKNVFDKSGIQNVLKLAGELKKDYADFTCLSVDENSHEQQIKINESMNKLIRAYQPEILYQCRSASAGASFELLKLTRVPGEGYHLSAARKIGKNEKTVLDGDLFSENQVLKLADGRSKFCGHSGKEVFILNTSKKTLTTFQSLDAKWDCATIEEAESSAKSDPAASWKTTALNCQRSK